MTLSQFIKKLEVRRDLFGDQEITAFKVGSVHVIDVKGGGNAQAAELPRTELTARAC